MKLKKQEVIDLEYVLRVFTLPCICGDMKRDIQHIHNKMIKEISK